jgi:hypothetical protein
MTSNKIGIGFIMVVVLFILGIISIGMSAVYFLGLWDTPILLVSMGSSLTFGMLFVAMLFGVICLCFAIIWVIKHASSSTRRSSSKK